jgi:DNA-binding response OmpR family regulator
MTPETRYTRDQILDAFEENDDKIVNNVRDRAIVAFRHRIEMVND